MYVCGKFVNSVESLKKTVSTISTSADKADLTAAVLDGDLLAFLKECQGDFGRLTTYLKPDAFKSQTNDEIFDEACRLLGVSVSEGKVATIHENMNGRVLISAYLDRIELGKDEVILQSDSTEEHTLRLVINIAAKTRAKRKLKIISSSGEILSQLELNLNEDRAEQSISYVTHPDSRDSIRVEVDGLHSIYKIACRPKSIYRVKKYQDPETGYFGFITRNGGFPVGESQFKMMEWIKELDCFIVRNVAYFEVYDNNGEKVSFTITTSFHGIGPEKHVVDCFDSCNWGSIVSFKGREAVLVRVKSRYYYLCREKSFRHGESDGKLILIDYD